MKEKKPLNLETEETHLRHFLPTDTTFTVLPIYKCKCFFCEGGYMYVNKNYFHCENCKRNGDSIEFVSLYNMIPRDEAIDIIIDKYVNIKIKKDGKFIH